MEERLDGGNVGGAVLVEGTVRWAAGPWTPVVHALLNHLERHGFDAAPRVLGVDEQGREVLTHLPGATVESSSPWPAWVRSEDTLRQVGRWLRGYHDTVADGFTDFADRSRRLRLLLNAYSYQGDIDAVLHAVKARIIDHSEGLRTLAASGDPLFVQLVQQGAIDDLNRAIAQLSRDGPRFRPAS